MKAIIQRCKSASVIVDNKIVGKCDKGFLILLGVMKGDDEQDVTLLAEKISKLRIFDDSEGRLNLSIKDIGGEALVVSNFTLAADYKKGNRPDYFGAEVPERANMLYEAFATALRERGIPTETGKFGAEMFINLIADGPVTIDMDSTVLRK